MDTISHSGLVIINLESAGQAAFPDAPVSDEKRRIRVRHSGCAGKKGRRGVQERFKFDSIIRGHQRPPCHIWIPRTGEAHGVVYRMDDYSAECHGAAPDEIVIMVQGNSSRRAPSDAQYDTLSAVIPYLEEAVIGAPCRPVSREDSLLVWGDDADDPYACPGIRLRRWLENYVEVQDLFHERGLDYEY